MPCVGDMPLQRFRFGRERSLVARSVGLLAALFTWSAAATAQPPSVPVNPRSIEFDLPAAERSVVLGYWLEVFRSGSDLSLAAQPLRVVYLQKSSPGVNGSLRLDLGSQLDGLADGEYVVTLRAVSRAG